MLVDKGALPYLYFVMEREDVIIGFNYNIHRAAGCGPAWVGGPRGHNVSIKHFPVWGAGGMAQWLSTCLSSMRTGVWIPQTQGNAGQPRQCL